MKTGILTAATGLLMSFSGSAQATVYSFSGSDGSRSITGSITYDPTAPIDSTTDFQFGNQSISFYAGELSFKSGKLKRSSDYVFIVNDAFELNAERFPDGLNAFVPASSRENYSLSFSYPDASYLTGTELPSTLLIGPADFYYSYAGDDFSVPVTLTAAVPEATTWVMMIMGFGFVGFAIRRRRPDNVVMAALTA